MRCRKVWVGLICTSVSVGSVVALDVLPAAASADLYISQSGNDTSNCQNQSNPCETIAYALSQAPSGATIHLAFGTYGGGETIASTVTIEGETPNVNIEPPFPGAPTLTVSGNATLKNLTFSVGASFYSTIVNTGTVALIDDTIQTFTQHAGLENDGGTATLTGDTLYAQTDGVDNNDGTVTFKDDTLTATSGAAVRNTQSVNPATITAIADTIVGNTGIGIANIGGAVTVAASILGNNGTNCSGSVIDAGYNLDSGNTCGFSPSTHSMSATNPDLLAEGNFGGGTLVQPPAMGSPTLGIIPPGTSGTDCPGIDQRGQPKPAPATACAIGAVQSVFPDAPTRTYSAVPNGAMLSVPASQGLTSGAVTDANLGPQAFTIGVPYNSYPAHGILDTVYTGAFTYTPAAGFNGTDTFSYFVIDSDGFVSALATVTVVVGPDPTITVGASPLSPATGQTVMLSSTSSGGLPPYSYAWSLSVRPAGSASVLSNPSAAAPTFVPDVPGSYQASLVVTDSADVSSPVAQVSVSVGVYVVTSSIPAATRGTYYSVQLVAAGANSFTWKSVGVLPKGLRLHGSGLLAGTLSPKKVSPGTYTLTVRATSRRSRGHPVLMATQSLSLGVS